MSPTAVRSTDDLGLDDPDLLDESALGRLHELADLGEVHPAWDGIAVERHDVAGTSVRVLRRPGTGDGPPVVFVHGLGGAATNWLTVLAALPADGDVLAVDLPGFGETRPARPGAARPRNNARSLAALLHRLDLGPVVLVGNSMGGLVATLTAGEHPGLVRELVLLGPALPPRFLSLRVTSVQVQAFGPLLVPGVGTAIMRRRMRRLTFAEQYDQMIDRIAATPDTVSAAQRAVGTANLARVRELRWRGPAFRDAFTGLLEALAGPARGATIEAMERVTAPTLYVRGRQDPLMLAATTALVERRCPDWVVEEPDHVGHVPMLEDPDWTARRIAAFVAGASVTPLS